MPTRPRIYTAILAALSLAAPGTHAQEPQPSIPHVIPRTVVTGLPITKPVGDITAMGIMTVYYDGKQIIPKQPFNAPDDWLQHLTIKIRNQSARTLTSGYIQLAFPGPYGDPMIFHYLRLGVTPKHQLYTFDTGKKVPQPKNETPISIQPLDYITFAFAPDYNTIRAKLEARTPLPGVALVVVDYGAFYFDGGFRWMLNSFRREDPDRPGKYIPTPPADFMPQPKSAH